MRTTANFNWVINAGQLKSEFDRINAYPGVPAGQINWFITMDRDAAGEVQLTGFFLARIASANQIIKSTAITKGSATPDVILDPPYVLGSIYLNHNDLLQINADAIDIILTPMKGTFTWPQSPPPPIPGSPVYVLYYTCNIGTSLAPRQLYPSPPATGSF